ncbi:MAG: glycoside hydrolase family 97 catalytic domain-containing protein, partial [Prevotella sp.]|nr:glycoside hydrolase family 97 catalytic domain-containing protein [Prevotella sp.]
IVRKYVDMAVEMRWPYVLIDAEWDEMKNGGNIEDAIRYAHDKGVKPILWYNSSTAWIKAWGAPGPHERLNAPENREREFAWLEKMGVAGVKIDFFAGDKQETMEYCIDLLECAARHHLMVNFHGATIPRGWQRTYPNLVSVEAVYGAEWYNNNATLTPKAAAHNATLPFTRNVIGPMDYTPCTFSDSQHKHITTHAHELALPVLFESPLLHWADKPESYLVQPKEVKDFMSALPTIWDETRLLGGYPGEWVVIARRQGNTWYVAGINGKDSSQTLSFDASFLPKGKYTLFTDKPGYKGELPANNPTPWSIRKGKGRIPEKIICQPRGGFVFVCRN